MAPQKSAHTPRRNANPAIYAHLDRYFRTVLTVAEERQFTRAAERLHQAQPWVSRQVHEVEVIMGVQLFERLHGGVRLTRGGGVLVQAIKRGISYLDRGVIKARAVGQLSELHLSIALSPTFASALGVRALNRLKAALPNTHFEIASQFGSQQVRHLLSSEVHIGFTELPLHSDELTAYLLRREKLRLAAAPGDALLQQKDLTPERLNQKPCVLLDAQENYWQRKVIHGLLKRGMKANNIREVLTVPEILTLVSTGQFFSVVPAFAETFACEGRVFFREIDGMYCDYGFAYEQDSQHPLLKQIVAVLLHEFAAERAEAESARPARKGNGKLN